MTELEKGPRGLRRGRGARERILGASRQLFRDQGINSTGMDQLCAVAQVSKRTFYQHFTGKDELIAEHLRRFDPDIAARGVRPHRPHTPRTAPRRLRHSRASVPVHRGGRRNPRPGPPGTRYTPATTRRLLPRGSPKPRARPAPPTPNNSANNWRCSWMALRPATESSTPTPSPPPPPSQSSSSTTPSPRQRYRPAQAGTCQPGRGGSGLLDRTPRNEHSEPTRHVSAAPLAPTRRAPLV